MLKRPNNVTTNATDNVTNRLTSASHNSAAAANAVVVTTTNDEVNLMRISIIGKWCIAVIDLQRWVGSTRLSIGINTHTCVALLTVCGRTCCSNMDHEHLSELFISLTSRRGDWKCGSGKCDTVKNARVENAGVGEPYGKTDRHLHWKTLKLLPKIVLRFLREWRVILVHYACASVAA